MKIIIDAMGGDNAPLEIVKGALQAQKRFGVDIVFTGDEAAILDAVRACGLTELPDGAAIVRGCAHEENARKFIDFLLSPDVQQLLGTELSRRSVRTDTASDALPELTVLPYDLRRADERRQELFDAWQALCGEVEA